MKSVNSQPVSKTMVRCFWMLFFNLCQFFPESFGRSNGRSIRDKLAASVAELGNRGFFDSIIEILLQGWNQILC
jgi:hypothetical protein